MPRRDGIPEVPSDLPAHHRAFWTSMRNVVVALQEGRSAVGPVINVKVTPVGAGNVIQFTRPLGADSVTLFASPSADFGGAVPIELGSSTVYRHELGTIVTEWYWLRTKRGNIVGSTVGPFKSTSLAAGAAATIPAAPHALGQPIQNSSTGHPATGAGGRGVELE